MKKLTFWKSLFLLCALIVGSTSAWADDATITFSNQSSGTSDSGTEYTTNTFVSNGIASSSSAFGTITCSATSKCYSGKTGCGLKVGASSSAGSFTVSFSTPLVNVTKVTLNRATYNTSKPATITVKNGSTTLGSASTSSTNTSFSDMEISNLNINSLGGITVQSDKYCYIKSITITYNPSGGGNTDPIISLSPTTIDATKAAVSKTTISVTYNNLTNYDADVIFYEADGTTDATYDHSWMTAEINSTTKNLEYSITSNTGSKRQAYLKVYALGDEGEVYSPLITVTQASGIDMPTFDPVGGTYTTAQDVTISCGTEGATIRYTTDGNDPDNNSAEYTGPISITNTGTVLKAIAYTEEGHSEIASATYTIRPIAPIISYVGTTVTITSAEGYTLYYTTNGSTPSNSSTEYTGPFDLNADCTIKAVAYDTYNNKGTVKTTNFKYLEISPKNINSGYYEKVTDASTLENGDAILIVYETGNCAMSTTQGSNNRDNASITISAQTNPKSIYSPTASVQKLVLVKNTESISDVETDVFYFYTGSGYLYAAGANSNNYLRTSLMPDEKNNSRATISISSGNATIAFQGESTKNHMRYNNSNDQKKFSCYASNSDFPLVQIYKEVVKNQTATISNAKYATFNNATYALDFSGTGISVYTATDNATSVTLNEITSGKVPAGTPVVLYNADVTETTAFNVPVIASADDPEGTNHLVVKDDGADVPNMFVLAKRNNKVGFYKWAGTKLSAGKVYLLGQSNEAREFLGFDDTATGIANVDINANDNFDENAPAYNLAGQRVNATYKGVVIVNGKKIVRK